VCPVPPLHRPSPSGPPCQQLAHPIPGPARHPITVASYPTPSPTTNASPYDGPPSPFMMHQPRASRHTGNQIKSTPRGQNTQPHFNLQAAKLHLGTCWHSARTWQTGILARKPSVQTGMAVHGEYRDMRPVTTRCNRCTCTCQYVMHTLVRHPQCRAAPSLRPQGTCSLHLIHIP
jgi:hypothetical protein